MSNTVGSTFGEDYSAISRYDGLNFSDCHDSCREEEGSGSSYPRNACECSNSVFYAEQELGIDCNLSRILYYYHPDYLGHNEYITDITGRPYPYFHYSAFGESLIEKNTNYGQFSSPYRFNGKELDPETGNYYYGARYYNPVWGIWLGVDPLAGEASDLTPYRYGFNNPITYIDPNGLFESTHTDEDGNVLAVYEDGDNGVYRHSGKGAEAEKSVKLNYHKNNTSAGGEKMGETDHWDEFVNPENGSVMTQTRIQFEKSWDGIIRKMKIQAKGMDLSEVMLESLPNGDFDIKAKYANVGAKLNGKYASSRSAGNYSAGQNASIASFGIEGVQISFNAFQRMAGALHKGGIWGLTQNIIYGKTYGPAPFYGELPYQYRMSKAGWESTKRK